VQINPSKGEFFMTAKTLKEADLARFTGSETWYRHGLVRRVLFTDGANYVADAAGAFWLLDEIALAQNFDKDVAKEAFQHWKLAVDLDKHTGELTCDDGDGRIVFAKTLDYTDFPLKEINFYYTDNTILLPSEY
jgi:hypothetical protein